MAAFLVRAQCMGFEPARVRPVSKAVRINSKNGFRIARSRHIWRISNPEPVPNGYIRSH